MKNWNELPKDMQVDEIKEYYDILCQHKKGLLAKRIFDIVFSGMLLIILFPVFLLISITIKLDSPGPVLFKQIRVTMYEKPFKIYKFRTMIDKAERLGSQVTMKEDMRVTKSGKFLRKYRLDELPQLINILIGDMTFVGTRPEVEKYVAYYTNEMKATLLLPAGVTSRTSIEYKDEERLLEDAENVDEVYIYQILPVKMQYNLKALKTFSFFNDIKTMFATVYAVIR